MSELILCKAPLAYIPFYIENAGINIYSLEELSYLSIKHTDLITEELMSSEFTKWIGEELFETTLQKELDDMIAKGMTLNLFMGRILKYAGYLTERELRETVLKIAVFQNKSEAEIRKIRADRLLSLERFSDAIPEYISILYDKDKFSLNETQEGNIYHDIGACYSRMFFFSEAKKSFKIAYDKNHNIETLKELLFLMLILKDEEGFNSIINEYLITPDIEDEVKSKFNKINESRDIHDFLYEIDRDMKEDKEKVNSLIKIWENEYTKNNGI